MYRKSIEDLSLRDLRCLLVEKRRTRRHLRLEHFYQTGRVISDIYDPPITDFFGKMAHREGAKPQNIRVSRYTRLEAFLFCMEFLIVGAIVFVILNSLSALGDLNQSIATTFQQPALEPTPLIREVVLPDGHTPPNSPGGVMPNEAEIPAHLRPVWQSLSNLPTPIPAVEQAIRI